MTGGDWADGDARCMAIYLDGSDDADRADDGSLLIDDDVLLLINSWWEPFEFTLPVTRPNQSWCPDIDPSVTRWPCTRVRRALSGRGPWSYWSAASGRSY
jgi:hypothetical protein